MTSLFFVVYSCSEHRLHLCVMVSGMLSSRDQLGLETKFNVLVLVLMAVGLVLVLVLKQIVLVLTHLGLVFSKFGNAKSTKYCQYR